MIYYLFKIKILKIYFFEFEFENENYEEAQGLAQDSYNELVRLESNSLLFKSQAYNSSEFSILN